MATKITCTHCTKETIRLHPILNIPLCANCQRQRPELYQYISKTRAMETYRLRPTDLKPLGYHEVDNPHYKKAAPMQLYMLSQIKTASNIKYGSAEPYIVGLKQFSDDRLQLFADQPEIMYQLTPEQLQYLTANRLDDLGFEVKIVGDVNRKDGGIDIIAIPKPGKGFPFLLAVQVKHHRTNRKTSVSEIRDLHGVVQSANSIFHMGMIVTNTAFTADARWFAENNQRLLRLRDGKDLCRWMRRDFINEAEYREIPNEITIAPGIKIAVPKTELWIPSD
jgi:Restriction endonuclease/XPA protein C-terminus